MIQPRYQIPSIFEMVSSASVISSKGFDVSIEQNTNLYGLVSAQIRVFLFFSVLNHVWLIYVLCDIRNATLQCLSLGGAFQIAFFMPLVVWYVFI